MAESVTTAEAGVANVEATAVTAGVAGTAEAAAAETQPEAVKTFTQEEADRLFQTRIGRLEKKWEGQRQKDIADAIAAYEAKRQEEAEAAQQAEATAQAEAAAVVTPTATTDPAQAEAAQKIQTSLTETLKRVNLEAEKRRASEAALAAEQAKSAALQRDLLIRQVAQEKGLNLAAPFLTLVEGDDIDTVGASLEALMELGRQNFTPKSIGAANTPPNPVPAAAAPGTTTSTRIEQQAKLQAIIGDPQTSPAARTEAIKQLAQL